VGAHRAGAEDCLRRTLIQPAVHAALG